jgi:hypothetical protein
MQINNSEIFVYIGHKNKTHFFIHHLKHPDKYYIDIAKEILPIIRHNDDHIMNEEVVIYQLYDVEYNVYGLIRELNIITIQDRDRRNKKQFIKEILEDYMKNLPDMIELNFMFTIQYSYIRHEYKCLKLNEDVSAILMNFLELCENKQTSNLQNELI